MLPITRASHTPYTAGAPLKYRRADVAPAQGIGDMDDGTSITADEDDAREAMSFYVPLPFKGQLVDRRV